VARRVFADLGIKLDNVWEGPTIMAWGTESLADLSKTLDGLIKKNAKIQVKTAVAEGQMVSFKRALEMPTRAEAIGRVIALALSPARRVASQITAPAGRIVGQIRSLKDRAPEASLENVPAPA
jgi:ribosomal protein L10